MRTDRRGHKHRTGEEWEETIRVFRASGLGLMEFCRQEHIHPGSLRKWEKLLAQKEIGDETFVEIPTPSISRGAIVELVFNSGLVVRIES